MVTAKKEQKTNSTLAAYSTVAYTGIGEFYSVVANRCQLNLCIYRYMYR